MKKYTVVSTIVSIYLFCTIGSGASVYDKHTLAPESFVQDMGSSYYAYESIYGMPFYTLLSSPDGVGTGDRASIPRDDFVAAIEGRYKQLLDDPSGRNTLAILMDRVGVASQGVLKQVREGTLKEKDRGKAFGVLLSDILNVSTPDNIKPIGNRTEHEAYSLRYQLLTIGWIPVFVDGELLFVTREEIPCLVERRWEEVLTESQIGQLHDNTTQHRILHVSPPQAEEDRVQEQYAFPIEKPQTALSVRYQDDSPETRLSRLRESLGWFRRPQYQETFVFGREFVDRIKQLLRSGNYREAAELVFQNRCLAESLFFVRAELSPQQVACMLSCIPVFDSVRFIHAYIDRSQNRHQALLWSVAVLCNMNLCIDAGSFKSNDPVPYPVQVLGCMLEQEETYEHAIAIVNTGCSALCAYDWLMGQIMAIVLVIAPEMLERDDEGQYYWNPQYEETRFVDDVPDDDSCFLERAAEYERINRAIEEHVAGIIELDQTPVVDRGPEINQQLEAAYEDFAQLIVGQDPVHVYTAVLQSAERLECADEGAAILDAVLLCLDAEFIGQFTYTLYCATTTAWGRESGVTHDICETQIVRLLGNLDRGDAQDQEKGADVLFDLAALPETKECAGRIAAESELQEIARVLTKREEVCDYNALVAYDTVLLCDLEAKGKKKQLKLLEKRCMAYKASTSEPDYRRRIAAVRQLGVLLPEMYKTKDSQGPVLKSTLSLTGLLQGVGRQIGIRVDKELVLEQLIEVWEQTKAKLHEDAQQSELDSITDAFRDEKQQREDLIEALGRTFGLLVRAMVLDIDWYGEKNTTVDKRIDLLRRLQKIVYTPDPASSWNDPKDVSCKGVFAFVLASHDWMDSNVVSWYIGLIEFVVQNRPEYDEALIPVLTDYLTICPTEREDVSSRAKVLLETIAQRSSDLALVMVPGAVEKFGAPGEHRTTRINTREHCTMLADVNERCAQAMVEPLIGFLESDDQRDGERVLVSIFKKYPSLRQTIITQGLDNESPNVCERFRTICIDLAQEDDMYVRYIAIAASDCLSSETTFSTANNNDTFSVSSNASMVLEQIIVDYPDIAKHLLPILGMIIFDYAVEEISLECRRISSNDTNLKRSCFLMIEAFRHCPGQRIAMLHKAFAEDRGLQVYNKYIDIFSEFIESYLDEVQPEMIAGCFELLINGRVYLELKIVPGMMGIEPYCIPSGEICGPCYAGESLLKLILRNNSDCHRIVLPGVLESFLNNVKPAEIDGPQNTRTGRKGPRVKVDRRYAAKACIGVLDNLRSANSNFPGLLQPFIEQGGEQEMSLEAVNLLMDVYSNKLDKTFSWGRNEEPSGELLRAFITANPQLGTIVLDYIFNNDPMSWFIGRNSDLPEHIYRTCPELRDRMISEMSRFENLIALLQLWDGEFLDLPSPDASL